MEPCPHTAPQTHLLKDEKQVLLCTLTAEPWINEDSDDFTLHSSYTLKRKFSRTRKYFEEPSDLCSSPQIKYKNPWRNDFQYFIGHWFFFLPLHPLDGLSSDCAFSVFWLAVLMSVLMSTCLQIYSFNKTWCHHSHHDIMSLQRLDLTSCDCSETCNGCESVTECWN